MNRDLDTLGRAVADAAAKFLGSAEGGVFRWDGTYEQIGKFVAPHVPKPLAVPREVVEGWIEAGMKRYTDPANDNRYPVYEMSRGGWKKALVDEIMAALAAHTTPRPTREEIGDAAVSIWHAMFDANYVHAQDPSGGTHYIREGIEALLDGHSEAAASSDGSEADRQGEADA